MKQNLIDLLKWYKEMGVCDGVASAPANFFVLSERSQALPPKSLNIRESASSHMVKKEEKTLQNLPPTDVPPVIKAEKEAKSMIDLSKVKTLEELREALERFNASPLKELAMNTVFADGNPKADIMLVGEAPGAEEDRQGKPFVGPSGQLLDRILATIGLDRTSAYISNIVPWRPPGNRTPSTEEIALFKPFITRHIELVHPKVLVMLGGIAAKALLSSNDGIMKIRGTWRTYMSPGLKEPIAAMATFHPAYLLRSPAQKALVWHDMLAIQKKLKEL